MTIVANPAVVAGWFVVPYFFVKVAYGPSNEYFLLNLAWIQVLLGVAVLARVLLTPTRHYRLLALHGIIVAGICTHYLWTEAGLDLDEALREEIRVKFLIALGYLTLALPASARIAEGGMRGLVSTFRALSIFSVGVCIVSLAFQIVTGRFFLLNNFAETWVRAHAFMTEPSALAAPVGFLVAYGVLMRDRLALLAGATGVVVTQSPIVGMLAGTGLAYALVARSRHRGSLIAGMVVLGAATAAGVMSYDCAREGSQNAVVWYAERAICGVQAVNQLGDAAALGVNERLLTTSFALDALDRYDAWWSGFGLNASAVLMPAFYGNVENSLFVSFMLFFGWPGLLLLALASLRAVQLSYRHTAAFGALYFCVLVSVAINSAGGFYAYCLFFLLLYLAYAREPESEPLTRPAPGFEGKRSQVR